MAPSRTPAPPLDDSRRRLVEDALWLVGSIAGQWRRRCRGGIDHDDLVQAGAIGLVDAARRFTGDDPTRFSAFARQRVAGAIRDWLRDRDPLSRGRRRRVRALDAARTDLASRLGRPPTSEELGADLGWQEGATRHALADRAALDGGWAQTLEAGDDASTTSDPHADLLRAERARAVAQAVRQLPERLQLVLSLHHVEDLTLKEVGGVLGVTESRACQLHSTATARLRTLLAGNLTLAA